MTTFRELEALVAVVEMGSFKGAARSLNTSQSAVSRLILGMMGKGNYSGIDYLFDTVIFLGVSLLLIFLLAKACISFVQWALVNAIWMVPDGQTAACRAINDHPRNLTDDQLRIIAASGGVAGVNFHAPFVTGGAEATLDDVVKQVEYLVKVAGIDHVAVGSDFDGGITTPVGLEDASTFPALAAALRRKGMSHDDVLRIFSQNALRVLGWRPLPPPTPAPQSP
mgnify:CR=1 FL=1